MHLFNHSVSNLFLYLQYVLPKNIIICHLTKVTLLLYLQVKVWHLNTTELLFQVKDTGVSIILGLLNGMVVSLSDGGLVTFSHPSAEDKTAQIHLENSSHSLTLTATLTLQKHGRLLIASKEGFLYQVQIVETCPGGG